MATDGTAGSTYCGSLSVISSATSHSGSPQESAKNTAGRRALATSHGVPAKMKVIAGPARSGASSA